MTQPGYVAPLTPGWWVRTNRVGTNASAYQVAMSAAGTKSPVGHVSGTYGWAGTVVGSSSVSYSATGAGNYSGTGAPTWSHTAAAGDYVVVGISAHANGTITACTYGGAAMTLLGIQYWDSFEGYGFTAAYGIVDATGGAKTIAITRSAANAASGNSVSYKGVNSVRAMATSHNTSTTMTQYVGMPYTQSMAVQMFAGQEAMTPSGGTNRHNNGGANAFLSIGDTVAGATFTATQSSTVWAGLSLILNPNTVGTELYVKGTNVTSYGRNGNLSTIPIPPHVSGDLIVLYAYRQDNTTTPTKPTAGGTVPAWVDIDNNTGANTNSSRTAYFVATASTTTSGTWTNAHGMSAVVLSGQHASAFIGGHAESGGTSTNNAVAPSVTMSVTNGSSILLHFFGRAVATYLWSAPPTGYSQYGKAPGGAGGLYGGACLDIKNVSTSDGAVTQDTDTTGSISYRGATVEILD